MQQFIFQMTKSCATRLINELLKQFNKMNGFQESGRLEVTGHSEVKGHSEVTGYSAGTGHTEVKKQIKDIKIIEDIRIPPNSVPQPIHTPAPLIPVAPVIETGRLDISIPLEQEIINDLNDCEHDSDSDSDDDDDDDYEPPDISEQREPETTLRQKKERSTTSYKCETEGCNVRLLAQENTSYHQTCHYGKGKDAPDAFKCPECEEFVSNRWNPMTVHLWRAHLIDMELHACDLCNYKTPSLSRLIHQHRGIHGVERPFVCETCGKGFKTSKQLRTHKIIHKPANSTNTFECKECQRVFKTKRLLQLHNTTVHKESKPFTCNVCDYSAATRSGLKLHLRKHSGKQVINLH